jgi:hypothetical protein
MTTWSIAAEPAVPIDGTNGPAMEVDPRRRTVRLGLRGVSGGGPEIASGAVVRTFFSGEVRDWSAAEAWLRSEEATALLDALAAGQDVHVVWSGDMVVEWSDAALAAGRELHAGVQDAVENRPEAESP